MIHAGKLSRASGRSNKFRRAEQAVAENMLVPRNLSVQYDVCLGKQFAIRIG